MSILQPTDPNILIKAVLDSLVIASDSDSRHSGMFYWEMAKPFNTAVVEAIKNCKNKTIREMGQSLIDKPNDSENYIRLREYLLNQDITNPELKEIFHLAWQCECNSRIGYYLGSDYNNKKIPISVDDLISLSPGKTLSDNAKPEVLIVIPFRNNNKDASRLRNLLSCLLALRDQSFPREKYAVTVVESDKTPQCQDTIEPYTDYYLFAEKDNMFNKSWAVNVGIVNTPGDFGVVCILDADALVDRDFIARNVERFLIPGRSGHLTYNNMSCLTDIATTRAINERINNRAPMIKPEHIRAFQLRGPPGCCIWVRTEIFYRIGGMDERYEGWGGEDNDFADRYDIQTPLGRYDDWLLHMWHPASSSLREDGTLINAHIPPLSWNPNEPIGCIHKFCEKET